MMRTTLICLHGFTMNAAGLRYMLADLEPRLADVVDFVYPDAPHTASPDSVAGLASLLNGYRPKPPNLEWWNASSDRHTYVGWGATRALLEREVARHPSAAILGFSQGAAVAAALAAASSRGEFPALGFVVLVAGFVARAHDIAPLFSEPVHVPSLHVYGDADPFAKHAPALLERFAPETREELRWSGRHVIPVKEAPGDALVEFIRRRAVGHSVPKGPSSGAQGT
jgi:pimeloyl-ACP methyl ester carboxylesterase